MKIKLLEATNNMPRGAIAEVPDYQAGNLIESGKAIDAAKVTTTVQPDNAEAQAPWLSIVRNRSMNPSRAARK